MSENRMNVGDRLRVGLVGNCRRLKSVGDLVDGMPEMLVVGVVSDTAIAEFALLRNWQVIPSRAALLAECDVVIETMPANQTTNLTSVRDGRTICLPHPAVLAVSRIADSLESECRLQKLSATIIQHCKNGLGHIDALLAEFDDSELNQHLADTLKNRVATTFMRTVTAPVTDSHLLMLRWRVATSIDKQTVLRALGSDPRIKLGLAGDGFYSTADVVEFYRDSLHNRGDQWEVFLWSESVMVRDSDVYMMASLSHAVVLPEILDSIYQLQMPSRPTAEVREDANRRLELRSQFTGA